MNAPNRKTVTSYLFFMVIVIFASPAFPGHASPIKSDEEVLFFPTMARQSSDGTSWILPIHGWIYEPEAKSMWRGVLIKALLKKLELGPEAEQSAIFRDRAKLFLVDNERGKKITVTAGSAEKLMETSQANGHFFGEIQVPIDALKSDSWTAVRAKMRHGDARTFEGSIQLADTKGYSIVSDIDDTIKESNVLDKKRLLSRTFLEEFQAVSGMSSLYRTWESQGASFHYVSSSPWQLYPALSAFIDTEKFPRGAFHLKTFRFKDQTFFDLFASAEKTKIPIIENLLKTNPEQKYIFVGDSGEKDPEVYGEIARRHKKQVVRIFIRNIKESDEVARFEKAFRDVPPDRWTVFRDPGEIKQLKFDN